MSWDCGCGIENMEGKATCRACYTPRGKVWTPEGYMSPDAASQVKDDTIRELPYAGGKFFGGMMVFTFAVAVLTFADTFYLLYLVAVGAAVISRATWGWYLIVGNLTMGIFVIALGVLALSLAGDPVRALSLAISLPATVAWFVYFYRRRYMFDAKQRWRWLERMFPYLVFEPDVKPTQSAPAQVSEPLQALLAGDTVIDWSERPGCFERHLQRRHNNPLFPSERQHVTAADVAVARRRDAQDFESLRAEYVQFLEDVTQLPDDLPSREVNPIRERIGDLTQRAAQVGGQASEIASRLTTFRRKLIQTWSNSFSDNPNALKELQEAEAFYHAGAWKFNNPFVAQMNRDDTPITREEVVPSILTEDVATIRTVMAALGEPVGVILARFAVDLVQEVRARGEMLPGIEEKLTAMGATIN